MDDRHVAPGGMSPGGEEAVAALAQEELKQALETIGIGEYDPAVRGTHLALKIRFAFACCKSATVSMRPRASCPARDQLGRHSLTHSVRSASAASRWERRGARR
jgi:hypothetical protein